MSANNFLLITKTKDGKYRVSNVDADGSGGFYISVKAYRTLRMAIMAAEDYASENEVEYGVKFGRI